MIYGCVNRYRGEDENFLKGRNVDKIVYCNNAEHDFTFLKKGDGIIAYEPKSVCNNLKGLLEFSQLVFQNEIDLCFADNERKTNNALAGTRTPFGKMMVNIMSALNEIDEIYFRKN